jgi:hypothetical protein
MSTGDDFDWADSPFYSYEESSLWALLHSILSLRFFTAPNGNVTLFKHDTVGVGSKQPLITIDADIASRFVRSVSQWNRSCLCQVDPVPTLPEVHHAR